MRYDRATRKRARRVSKAERGVWIFVPAVELEKAGVDPHGPIPFYRVWGAKRGGLVGRFYREP